MLLNIFHVHINDSSEQIPIDCQWLNVWDYGLRDVPFEKDAMGQELRLKILVYNYQIRDVLYNFGGGKIEPVAFEEKKIDKDQFYVLDDGKIFGKITQIPICMTSSEGKDFVEKVAATTLPDHKKVNFCGMRYFEQMAGYVEFEIWSDDNLQTLKEERTLVQSNICHLKPASPD